MSRNSPVTFNGRHSPMSRPSIAFASDRRSPVSRTPFSDVEDVHSPMSKSQVADLAGSLSPMSPAFFVTHVSGPYHCFSPTPDTPLPTPLPTLSWFSLFSPNPRPGPAHPSLDHLLGAICPTPLPSGWGRGVGQMARRTSGSPRLLDGGAGARISRGCAICPAPRPATDPVPNPAPLAGHPRGQVSPPADPAAAKVIHSPFSN